MEIEVLRKIGLTNGESKVYLALLKLGQTTTGPIVRRAGVATSKSYKILARLEEKGLVSHVFKNKVKYFKSASPERILEIFEEQSKDFEEKKKEIEKLIPELLSYTNKLQEEPEAEVYYGLEGLETLFNQQVRELNKGETNYVIGITHIDDYGESVANFFRHLQKERDKKGIISNFLLGENARGSFDYMKKSRFCNLRYLPYASLVSINIHKETSIIGVFVAGRPILFKISSKEVANTFIEYFKLLWRIAKR